MEDDNPNARPPSFINDAAFPLRDDYPSAQNPDPNRIVAFNEAVAVLRRHTLKNVPDFQLACRHAKSVHRSTFLAINKADINNLHDARGQLNHSDNFLAYIAVLHATLANIQPDSPLVNQLLVEYKKLVQDTPAEWAKVVPTRWVGVSRHAARLAIESRNIAHAQSLICSLRNAVAKSEPRPDYLVPLQADFLALCLQAKCYKLAASWIRETRRLQVDVPSTGLVGTDVHLIHHYSALVFIGVKDFRAALQCCRLALSVPAPSPGRFGDVACATFMLFVLLQLLVNGKAPSPLKFSSYQSPRMRKMTSEYMEISYAYENRDNKQLHQLVASNRDVFEKHGNLGLVKQVLSGLSEELIMRLTRSFVTMKLEDVAARVGLASSREAHHIILDMIEDGKINACIDDRNGIVRFMDNDVAEEERIGRNLSRGYLNDCVNIVQRLESFRETLESDPNYLLKESVQGRKGSQGLGSLATVSARMGGIDAELLR